MLVGANSSRDAALWVYGPFYACTVPSTRASVATFECASTRVSVPLRAWA